MNKPTLPPGFWAELAEHNPIGILLDASDAEAWFDFVWLRYTTYGYRNHKRAIISWWSRVNEADIQKARERVARIQDERETAALENFARTRGEPNGHESHPKVVPIDYAARLEERGADRLRPRQGDVPGSTNRNQRSFRLTPRGDK